MLPAPSPLFSILRIVVCWMIERRQNVSLKRTRASGRWEMSRQQTKLESLGQQLSADDTSLPFYSRIAAYLCDGITRWVAERIINIKRTKWITCCHGRGSSLYKQRRRKPIDSFQALSSCTSFSHLFDAGVTLSSRLHILMHNTKRNKVAPYTKRIRIHLPWV